MTAHQPLSPQDEPRDEPLKLNPWDANDPKGMAGKPDALPTPHKLAMLRYVVLLIALINLALYLLPVVNDYVSFGSILFPILGIIFTTRNAISKVTQVAIAPRDLGTLTWQKFYNSLRLFFIAVAGVLALLVLAQELLIMLSGGEIKIPNMVLASANFIFFMAMALWVRNKTNQYKAEYQQAQQNGGHNF